MAFKDVVRNRIVRILQVSISHASVNEYISGFIEGIIFHE
jgi:hypothetical protein